MAGAGGGVQPQSQETDGTLTAEPSMQPPRHDTEPVTLNVSEEEAAAAAALVGLFGAPTPEVPLTDEHKSEVRRLPTTSTTAAPTQPGEPIASSSNVHHERRFSPKPKGINAEKSGSTAKDPTGSTLKPPSKRPISPITFDLHKSVPDSVKKKVPISPIRFKPVEKATSSSPKLSPKLKTKRPISPIIFDRTKTDPLKQSPAIFAPTDVCSKDLASAKADSTFSSTKTVISTGSDRSGSAKDTRAQTVNTSPVGNDEQEAMSASRTCNATNDKLSLDHDGDSKVPSVSQTSSVPTNVKDNNSATSENASDCKISKDNTENTPGVHLMEKAAMPQSSNTMSSQPLVPEESKGSDPQVSQRKEKDEKQAAKVLGSVSEDSPAQNTDYPLQENISPSVTSNATVAATKLSTSVTTAGSEGSSISNRAVPEDNSADKPIVKTTPRTGTAPVRKPKGKPLPARGARTAANKKIAETGKVPAPKQSTGEGGDVDSATNHGLTAVPAPSANARTPSKIRKTGAGSAKTASAAVSRSKKRERRGGVENANSAGRVKRENVKANDDDDYVTRCVCGFTHNDDFMVSCDRCEVWQHIECFQDINKDQMPEHYFCEQCKPRPFNAAHARRIQMIKLAQLAKIEGGDGSDSGSDDDDGDDEEEEADDDEDNDFSGEHLLASSSFKDDTRGMVDGSASPRRVLMTDVNSSFLELRNIPSKRRQGVFASNTLPPRTFLGLLPGAFRRASKVPEWVAIKRKKQPFIWKHPTLDLCLDARNTESVAKHVRRSCCPNSEIVIIVCGSYRGLGLYTMQMLDPDEEISVAYDFDFMATQYKGENACAVPGCVKREAHQRKRQRSQPQLRIHIPRGAPDASEDGGTPVVRASPVVRKNPSPAEDVRDTTPPTPADITPCSAPPPVSTAITTAGNTRSVPASAATSDVISAPNTPKPAATPLVFPSDKPLSREERKLMAIMRQFAALEGDPAPGDGLAGAGGVEEVPPAADGGAREGEATPSTTIPGATGNTTPRPRGRSRSRATSVTTPRDGTADGQPKILLSTARGAGEGAPTGNESRRGGRGGSSDYHDCTSDVAHSDVPSAKDGGLATVAEAPGSNGGTSSKRPRALGSPSRMQSAKTERNRSGGAGRASRHNAGTGTGNTSCATPRAPKRDDSLFATGYAGSAAYGGFQIDSGRTPARSKRAARHMDAVLARRVSAAQTPPAVHVRACKEAIATLFTLEDLTVLQKWRAPQTKPPPTGNDSTAFSDCSKKKRVLLQWTSTQSKRIKTEVDPSTANTLTEVAPSVAVLSSPVVKLEVIESCDALNRVPSDAPSVNRGTPAGQTMSSPASKDNVTTAVNRTGSSLDLFDDRKPSPAQLHAAMGVTPPSRGAVPPAVPTQRLASGPGSRPPPRPDWGWDANDRPPLPPGAVPAAQSNMGVRSLVGPPEAQFPARVGRDLPDTPNAGGGVPPSRMASGAAPSMPTTPTTPGMGGAAFFNGTTPSALSGGGGVSPRVATATPGGHTATAASTPGTATATKKKISLSDYIKNRRKGKKPVVASTASNGTGTTTETTPLPTNATNTTAISTTSTNATNDVRIQQTPQTAHDRTGAAQTTESTHIKSRAKPGGISSTPDGSDGGGDSRKRAASPGVDTLASSGGVNAKVLRESKTSEVGRNTKVAEEVNGYNSAALQ